MPRIWDDLLTDLDRAIYREAGYGTRAGPGKKPALLVVDVTYNFVGDKPEPVLESIKKFPNSCGEVGWRGMEQIRKLLDVSRDLEVPIFYTTGMGERNPTIIGSWAWKHSKTGPHSEIARQIGNNIPDLVAPRPGEIVVKKTKPSAFYGTALHSYLTALEVDTVIVAGTTTSGCVRATVIDSFSANFRTLVVEECVFDRGDLPHKANLFDMDAKYADVVSLEETIEYLHSVKPELVPARG